MADDDSLDDFAKLVWSKRSEGLPVVGFDLTREITPKELDYMQQKFAFVQILNPHATGEYSNIRFIKADSGWVIFDYSNAMSASPGEMLFTDEAYRATEEGDFERICTGKGSRIKQIIDTASEMVMIAQQNNWSTVHIVDGHELMKWAIWKAAQDLQQQGLQLEVTGYEPPDKRKKKYQRILEIVSHVTPTAKP